MNEIIKEFLGRKGFDYWWADMDEDVQTEIIASLDIIEQKKIAMLQEDNKHWETIYNKKMIYFGKEIADLKEVNKSLLCYKSYLKDRDNEIAQLNGIIDKRNIDHIKATREMQRLNQEIAQLKECLIFSNTKIIQLKNRVNTLETLIKHRNDIIKDWNKRWATFKTHIQDGCESNTADLLEKMEALE